MITTSNCKSANAHDGRVLNAYVVFLVLAVVVYALIAKGEFSAVLTLSNVFQCLAFSILGVQMMSTQGLQGISSRTLMLDATAIACRLSSTLWLNGYLPEDITGEHLYQIMDVISLVMVLALLHSIMVSRKNHGCDEEPVRATPFVAGALVLASLLHGDLNDRPVFDALWMCGVFLSAVSVVPQLWLMARSETTVPALTSHFVAVMAFARILSGMYMWHAHEELTCDPCLGDINHTGYAVLCAHAAHLLLLADFAYLYCKNVTTSGFGSNLNLHDTWIV